MKVELAEALEALGQGRRVRATTQLGDYWDMEIRDNVLYRTTLNPDSSVKCSIALSFLAFDMLDRSFEVVPREEVVEGLSITDLPTYPEKDGWELTCEGRDGVYGWEVGYLGWRFRGGTDIYVKVESDMLKGGVWTARRVG